MSHSVLCSASRQTSVQNLEALAKQSKIVYSVMGNSSIAAYFENMAHAENALFRWWPAGGVRAADRRLSHTPL